MKCRECSSCCKGYWASSPETYVCTGVKEPFEVLDINAECTEYPKESKATIVKKEVKAHMVHAMCDCGGEFVSNGMVLTTYPCQYSHDCNKCGKRETFYERYPKIEYEEVE